MFWLSFVRPNFSLSPQNKFQGVNNTTWTIKKLWCTNIISIQWIVLSQNANQAIIIFGAWSFLNKNCFTLHLKPFCLQPWYVTIPQVLHNNTCVAISLCGPACSLHRRCCTGSGALYTTCTVVVGHTWAQAPTPAEQLLPLRSYNCRAASAHHNGRTFAYESIYIVDSSVFVYSLCAAAIFFFAVRCFTS